MYVDGMDTTEDGRRHQLRTNMGVVSCLVTCGKVYRSYVGEAQDYPWAPTRLFVFFHIGTELTATNRLAPCRSFLRPSERVETRPELATADKYRRAVGMLNGTLCAMKLKARGGRHLWPRIVQKLEGKSDDQNQQNLP